MIVVLADVIDGLMERIKMSHTFNPLTKQCVRCGVGEYAARYSGKTKCHGALVDVSNGPSLKTMTDPELQKAMDSGVTHFMRESPPTPIDTARRVLMNGLVRLPTGYGDKAAWINVAQITIVRNNPQWESDKTSRPRSMLHLSGEEEAIAFRDMTADEVVDVILAVLLK